MKATLSLLSFTLSVAAQAETFQCPEYYPAKPVVLSDAPAGHRGSGLIRGAKLSSAYISTDTLHSDPSGFNAMQLTPQKVKGGWDTEDHFQPGDNKWLVCVYGGDGRSSMDNPRAGASIEWWEKLSPNLSYCALHFREVKSLSRAPSDWIATAICK